MSSNLLVNMNFDRSKLCAAVLGTLFTLQPIGAIAETDESSPNREESSEYQKKSSGDESLLPAKEAVLQTIKVKSSKNKPKKVNVGKVDQKLREIPQSITVISHERIEEQGLTSLDNVMMQTTGVTREELWLNNNYTSRGLQITNIRYDGSAASTIQDGNNSLDTAQFDSVALLRGADGLFGAGEAGGVINLTFKRPKADRQVTASVSGGQWNNYRTELDATDSLGFDGALRGRVVGVFEDKDHFYKPSHNRREMIYAALEGDLTPDTVLFAGVSYQKDRNKGFNASLPRYSDGTDIGLPRSTSAGAPWGWIERENKAVFAILEHQLTPDWKVKLNVRNNKNDGRINGAEIEDAVDPSTLQGASWWRYQDKTGISEFTADLNLQGSFDAFDQHHDLILGVDTASYKKNYAQNWTKYGDADIFNRVAPPELDYPPADWDTLTRNTTKTTSAYGSIRIRPMTDLSVILGGRYKLKEDVTSTNLKTNIQGKYEGDKQFTPYYGIIYDVSPQTSLYASLAKIYQSQSQYLAGPPPTSPEDIRFIDPATGKSLEFGIKTDLLKDRLSGSLAFYRIAKKGKASYDPSYSFASVSNSYCCYIGDGNLKSQGLDVELNGKVTPELEVSVGYTYNQNEDKQDSNAKFNTVTPKHLLKLWSNYKFKEQLQGFSLGGGVIAQSKSYKSGSVQLYNPASGKHDGAWVDYEFDQKAYAVWSMQAAYQLDPHWTVSANLNNVFDKTYYSTIGTSGYGNFYGEPRNFMLTLRAKY